MDNEPNIFIDAGTSGLESDASGGNDKSAASVNGIEGRINPAIARATSAENITPATAVDGNNGGNPGGNAAGDTAGQQPGPKKRGRPAGSRNTADSANEKAETPRNIRASFIEKTLHAIHLGVATISKCPEFELEADDAKKLGQATADVLAFYKVKMTPKQEAYGVLIEVAATIYPPMFVSLYFRKMAEAKERERTPQPVPQPARAASPVPQPPSPPTGFDPGRIVLPPST